MSSFDPPRATRDPHRTRIPRHACYRECTRPEAYCATVSAFAPPRATRHPGIPIAHAFRGARAIVIPRVPRRTVLQCRHVVPTRATRDPRRVGFPRCPCYSDHTRPEAYVATVSPCNPSWWLPTSRDSNHNPIPSHTRYSDRTRLEACVAIVSARTPRWLLAGAISGFQSHSHLVSHALQ